MRTVHCAVCLHTDETITLDLFKKFKLCFKCTLFCGLRMVCLNVFLQDEYIHIELDEPTQSVDVLHQGAFLKEFVSTAMNVSSEGLKRCWLLLD